MKLRIYWWYCIKGVQWMVSGEFMVYRNANGGAVVAMRALFTAIVLFLFTIGLVEITAEHASWRFDWGRLKAQIHDKVPWFGALFAASYAAFYTRFSAQWAYLGSLYNQLMTDTSKTNWFLGHSMDPGLAERWAAFIEDAEELHLALKMNYAIPLHALLRDKVVRDAYMGGRPNRTEKELNALRKDLRSVIGPWPAMEGEHGPTDGHAASLTTKVFGYVNDAQSAARKATEAAEKANAAVQELMTAAAEAVRNAEQAIQRARDKNGGGA